MGEIHKHLWQVTISENVKGKSINIRAEGWGKPFKLFGGRPSDEKSNMAIHCNVHEKVRTIDFIEKLSLLRMVPTNSKIFLHGLLNVREKQILTSVIEIQKENWG